MTYTLQLTEQQINIIAHGLEQLPYKVSATVIAELSKQVQQQQQEKPDA